MWCLLIAISNVMAFTRQSGEGCLPLTVTPLVREFVKTFSATLPENISVRLETTAEDDAVSASPLHIHRILTHLWANALDAMTMILSYGRSARMTPSAVDRTKPSKPSRPLSSI